MSQWQEQIREHAVWQQLDQVGRAIDEIEPGDGLEAAGADVLERARAVITVVGRRLASLDPALVPASALQALSSALQALLGELQGLASDRQPQRLETVNTHLSEVLLQLSRFIGPGTEDLAALSEAAAAYRSSMQDAVARSVAATDRARTGTEQLAQRVAEISNEVQAERTKLTQLASEFQGQFSAAQDSRATDYSENQNQRAREFAETQAARQARFDELLARHSQKLIEQDAESTRQREEATRSFQEQLTVLNAEYRAGAEAILEAIRGHQRDVEKLVGVIGNLGVTSGYLKTADFARKATIVWQGAAVLALLGLAVFAYRAFLPLTQGTFAWETFAGRVFMSLSVGVIAAYAASQADKYMEIERRNRKLALELEALGPYLAPLPEEKQQEFRLAVGDRTFGRDEAGLGKRDRSPATVLDILPRRRLGSHPPGRREATAPEECLNVWRRKTPARIGGVARGVMAWASPASARSTRGSTISKERIA